MFSLLPDAETTEDTVQDIVGVYSADDFAEVTSLFKAGAYAPVVDSVHTAEQGRAAYERLESGEQFGKVVIRWDV